MMQSAGLWVGEQRWNVEQSIMSNFEPTDRIGWSSVLDDHWLGVVVISEPDPAGWHIAWYTDDPNVIYHWRGPASKRDSRWQLSADTFLIQEVP